MRTINTVSNAVYAVASFAVMHDPFLFVSLWVLALGSGWYHWKRGKWSQRADHLGMFLVLSALAIPVVPWWGYVVVAAVCAVLALKGVCSAAQVVTALGAIVIATQPTLERALIGLALFAWAYFLWGRDGGEWWAEEGKPMHAAWHLITAMAFVVLA